MGAHSAEHELLADARAGSQQAGRRLVAEYAPSMVRTAWNVLGRYGAHEADDVVQEAFIAALTTPALPAGDLGAWLRAITVRKALDSVRRAQRRAEEPLQGTEPPSNPGAEPAALAVREALRLLAPMDRAVLTLVDLEGHSTAEAAAVLGVSSVAIRLRAVRARRRLLRWLR
ncbi:MAG TPA: RNA polymerase sigma factor [Candidatus Polarisedimenticolaceae bacterium]|nr:RNA polymerase sigma factor [Candidatus Polarisedimenticolaceae bacterium]